MAATGVFVQLGLLVLAGLAVRMGLGRVPGGARAAAAARAQLNRFTVLATMPALVFQTVHGAAPGADLLRVPALTAAGMAGTAAIAWLVLARRHGPTPATGGLVLAACAGNMSFLGIPLVRALFGPADAPLAVYSAMLNFPCAALAGALISGRVGRPAPAPPGGDARWRPLRAGARQFLALPATWALVAGLALRPLALPPPLAEALRLLALLVTPGALLALGLGLRFERALAPYRMALLAALIKLAVNPLVVLACAWPAGLSGEPLAVAAFQGAMPTMTLTVVLAERYRLDARLVGLTLALDTALAFVLLPLLLLPALRTAAAA
jgi:predicted permease